MVCVKIITNFKAQMLEDFCTFERNHLDLGDHVAELT